MCVMSGVARFLEKTWGADHAAVCRPDDVTLSIPKTRKLGKASDRSRLAIHFEAVERSGTSKKGLGFVFHQLL
jgi:hypothetical protein